MDILISSYKKLSDMIWSGFKPFEFRHSIPKKLKIGDRVFVYETAPGKQKVVGEFTLGGLSDLSGNRLGFVPFMQYYVSSVMCDQELFALVKRCYRIEMPYNPYMALKYMFCEDILNYIEVNHDIPHNINSFENKEQLERADQIISDCDTWLTQIGFYNSYGESDYRYCLEIKNPIKYDNPYPLNEFIAGNGNRLSRAPQSWCYVTHT